MALVEWDEVIRPVVPRAAACEYRGWVRIGVTGFDVSRLFPAVEGFPEAHHLVCLLLLEEGDGRVDPEETKDAGEAILYLHGALIVAICEVLDKVLDDKGNRGAILARGARDVRVFVR